MRIRRDPSALATVITVLIVMYVYRAWFLPGFPSGGDFWPVHPSSYTTLSLLPSAWGQTLGYGLGASTLPQAWFTSWYYLPVYVLGKILGMGWDIVSRVGYLWPFLILACASPYLLARRLGIPKQYAAAALLVYASNTYALMLSGGGQMGIAIAYAAAPLVLIGWINGAQRVVSGTVSSGIRAWIITGLAQSILMLLDLRIGYMMGIVAMLLLVYRLVSHPSPGRMSALIACIGIVGIIVAGVHAFWIIPMVLYPGSISRLGSAYTGPGMVTYLSFADFSQSLSLLHPNWPENIFGKVRFFQPEFLLLPLIGFFPLLRRRPTGDLADRIHLPFLMGTVMVGAFLAKGTNDPAGWMYMWMFSHIPGFVMFRDPTKFYLFVSLGYAVIVPYALWNLGDTKIMRRGPFPGIVLAAFMILWGFTVRDGVTRFLPGTLTPREYPLEYRQLSDFLKLEGGFSRTLWVPWGQQYAPNTSVHPMAEAGGVLEQSSISGILHAFEDPRTEKLLTDAAVKYVVVPDDTMGTIFVTDHTYDQEQRDRTIAALNSVAYLVPERNIGNLAIWRVSGTKPLMWSEPGTVYARFDRRSDTQYAVHADGMQSELYVSMRYDPYWQLCAGTVCRSPERTDTGFLRFRLADMPPDAILSYRPQRAMTAGIGVAVLTCITAAAAAYMLGRRQS